MSGPGIAPNDQGAGHKDLPLPVGSTRYRTLLRNSRVR